MRADYVLCNNAVIIKDHKNRQCVAIGKGIGFNKRKGDIIDPQKVKNLYIEEAMRNKKIAN